MKPGTITPTIIIDTREQEPWTFTNLPSERGTLQTGDYSIGGLTHLIAAERKNLNDFLACCGRDRDRFKAEMLRLQAYRFRAVFVEEDLQTILRGPGHGYRSQISTQSVLGSIAAWMAQFNLPVLFCRDHDTAGQMAERWLFQCARCISNDYSAASAIAGTAEPAGSD